jgi:hypothetical protein
MQNSFGVGFCRFHYPVDLVPYMNFFNCSIKPSLPCRSRLFPARPMRATARFNAIAAQAAERCLVSQAISATLGDANAARYETCNRLLHQPAKPEGSRQASGNALKGQGIWAIAGKGVLTRSEIISDDTSASCQATPHRSR